MGQTGTKEDAGNIRQYRRKKASAARPIPVTEEMDLGKDLPSLNKGAFGPTQRGKNSSTKRSNTQRLNLQNNEKMKK